MLDGLSGLDAQRHDVDHLTSGNPLEANQSSIHTLVERDLRACRATLAAQDWRAVEPQPAWAGRRELDRDRGGSVRDELGVRPGAEVVAGRIRPRMIDVTILGAGMVRPDAGVLAGPIGAGVE